MKNLICYLNGKYVPLSQAQISILDIGLLRGLSIFDFLRCYNGRLFLPDFHFQRFHNSAKAVGLKIPLSDEAIKKIILQLLAKNKLKEATAKIFLTGGESPDGLSFNLKTPTFFIIVSPAPAYPKSLFEKGAKLITHNHQREKAVAKTSNYLTLLSLKKQKEKSGALEILYTSNGLILEGATSNFFLIKNKVLITAKNNVLLGTRRRLILQLAKNKFKVEERPVKISELKNCDEAFICSTTRNIVPIVKIDNLKIGNGRVGPVTKELMELIQKKIKKDCY